MCQYSSDDGLANDWHLVHLGSRAVGGAALVMTEATAVLSEGRSARRTSGSGATRTRRHRRQRSHFLRRQGCGDRHAAGACRTEGEHEAPVEGAGAVLRRRGRVGSRLDRPTGRSRPGYPVPRPLDAERLRLVVEAFRAAAVRARDLGFQVRRGARRPRLPAPRVPVAAQQRAARRATAAPSTTVSDCVSRSWRRCARCGPTDCRSSFASRPLTGRRAGGRWSNRWNSHGVFATAAWTSWTVRRAGTWRTRRSRSGPATRLRLPNASGARPALPTGAVGLITTPAEADAIVRGGPADAVLLARALLRDPHWPLHAAQALGVTMAWPPQYLGLPRGQPITDVVSLPLHRCQPAAAPQRAVVAVPALRRPATSLRRDWPTCPSLPHSDSPTRSRSA